MASRQGMYSADHCADSKQFENVDLSSAVSDWEPPRANNKEENPKRPCGNTNSPQSAAKSRDSRDYDYVAFDLELDPPFQCCFNCWQSGHAYMDCHQPQRGYYCYRCGRRGVSVASCPRCCSGQRRRPRSLVRNSGNGKQEEGRSSRNLSRSSQEAPETADPVHDFILLMESISHLSVETQNSVVEQVVKERKSLFSTQRNSSEVGGPK